MERITVDEMLDCVFDCLGVHSWIRVECEPPVSSSSIIIRLKTNSCSCRIVLTEAYHEGFHIWPATIAVDGDHHRDVSDIEELVSRSDMRARIAHFLDEYLLPRMRDVIPMADVVALVDTTLRNSLEVMLQQTGEPTDLPALKRALLRRVARRFDAMALDYTSQILNFEY